MSSCDLAISTSTTRVITFVTVTAKHFSVVVAYSSGVVDQEKKTACAACALIVDANNE